VNDRQGLAWKARLPGWLFAVIACAVAIHTPAVAQDVDDPLEPVNRVIFNVNDTLDRYALEPVARGYRYATPDQFKISLANVLSNLSTPVVLVNDVLQGEPGRALDTLGRFLINTTLGVGGLFDVAGKLDLPRHDEDLGQTFGVWGAGPGPFLMLPLLGPSTVRDAGGRVGDFFFDPLNTCCIDTAVRYGRDGAGILSTRESLIDSIDDLRKNSIDPYATVRTVYLQSRAAEIANGRGLATSQEYEDIFNEPDDSYEPLQ